MVQSPSPKTAIPTLSSIIMNSLPEENQRHETMLPPHLSKSPHLSSSNNTPTPPITSPSPSASTISMSPSPPLDALKPSQDPIIFHSVDQLSASSSSLFKSSLDPRINASQVFFPSELSSLHSLLTKK